MPFNLVKRNLAIYDIEAGIDTSRSMERKDTPSGLSRLEDCKQTISVLVKEAGVFDKDGITVWCFDTDIHDVNENTTDETAQAVLRNARATGDGTDHAAALKVRVDDYLGRLLGRPGTKGTKGGFFAKGTPDIPAVPPDPSTKPRIYVVVTDGSPSDGAFGERALETLIVDTTKRLAAAGYGRDRIGFSFIQTGRDAGASAFLERLNNGLVAKGAAFDCVNSLAIHECDGLTTMQILEKALDD